MWLVAWDLLPLMTCYAPQGTATFYLNHSIGAKTITPMKVDIKGEGFLERVFHVQPASYTVCRKGEGLPHMAAFSEFYLLYFLSSFPDESC